MEDNHLGDQSTPPSLPQDAEKGDGGWEEALITSLEVGSSSKNDPARLDDDGGGSEEGMNVEARYRGGAKYYKGKIQRKRLNGTYDILYEDGEKELEVSADLINFLDGGGSPSEKRRDDSDTEKAAPIEEADAVSDATEPLAQDMEKGHDGWEEGMSVEVRYRGGAKYFKGKIECKLVDGTFDILYDDGDREMGVSADLIRSLDGGSPSEKRRDDSDTEKAAPIEEAAAVSDGTGPLVESGAEEDVKPSEEVAVINDATVGQEARLVAAEAGGPTTDVADVVDQVKGVFVLQPCMPSEPLSRVMNCGISRFVNTPPHFVIPPH